MSVVAREDWKGKAEELLKTRKLTMSGRLRRIISRCELLWMVEVEVAVLCCSGVRCGKRRTRGRKVLAVTSLGRSYTDRFHHGLTSHVVFLLPSTYTKVTEVLVRKSSPVPVDAQTE